MSKADKTPSKKKVVTKRQKPPERAAGDDNADALLGDIRQLIREARQSAAVAVNAGLTFMYWRIGKRILHETLRGGRADYGQEILPTLSAELVPLYGRGFSARSLWRMVQFAEVFPDETVVITLVRQLSWSHFQELLPLKQPMQREFYAEMCRIDGWSVRILRERIDSMLYERTALSRKPEQLIEAELQTLRMQNEISPTLILKDPYVLDFLGVSDHYQERDLEDAILRELEAFLLELASGFSFIARQKRIQIDGEDFYIDLLFFNRRLKRLVAVELKLGRFKHAYKSQMELYLRWLDKHERQEGELSPLGILLCAGKDAEQVELLELDKSGIHVADYLTELPSRDQLHTRLQAAIKQARARYPEENSSNE